MNKIIAILCGVAILFVSCNTGGGDNEQPKPNFPTAQEFAVEAGESYELVFTVDFPCLLQLPAASQQYATLRYGGDTDTQFYIEAGEHTATINIKSGVGSYARDLVFNVELASGKYTEALAVCTLARIPYIINVSGRPNAGFEESSKARFSAGGHPENGPFVYSANCYTLRHYSKSEATYGDYIVWHDYPREKFNYVVYVKDARGQFVAVAGDDESKYTEPTWVEFTPFEGTDPNETSEEAANKVWQKFRLAMNTSSSYARFTRNVGYEAYVNLEDENGDAVVSVYHVFDPNAEVVTETSFGLANIALATEKCVTLVGNGNNYTLTIPTIDILTENVAAATLSITGYTEIYASIAQDQLLDVIYDKELNTLHIALKEGVDASALLRTDTLTISALGDSVDEYTVSVVFEWSTNEEVEDEVEGEETTEPTRR